MSNLPFLTGSGEDTPHGWLALVNAWAELNLLYMHGPSRSLFAPFSKWKVLRNGESASERGVRPQIPMEPLDSLGIISAAMWHVLKDIERVAVQCGEATAKRVEPYVIRPIGAATLGDPDSELLSIPGNDFVSFHDGKLKSGEDAGRYVLLDAAQFNEAAINACLRNSRGQESRDRQALERIWERQSREYLREHGAEGLTRKCLKEIIVPDAGVNAWKRVCDRLKPEFPELGMGGRRRKTSTPKKR